MFDPYSSNPYETSSSPKINVEYKRNRGSNKKNGIGTVNAGGAVIIIIFVVLCLTIFGLLSFATAFADKKLADRNLQSIARYYKADSEAEEKLAVIHDVFYNKMGADPSESEIRNILEEIDVQLLYLDNFSSEIEAAVSFKTNMGISRDAEVQFYLTSGIEFYYNINEKSLTYKITEWKIMSDSDFDYDEDILDVWIPDFNWGDSGDSSFFFGDD